MNKSELTKCLFPYALEIAKTYNLSSEDKNTIGGDVKNLHIADICKANEFMNICIKKLIQDIAKNFTIEELTKFMMTAVSVSEKGFSGYAVEQYSKSMSDNSHQQKRRRGRPRKSEQIETEIYSYIDNNAGKPRKSKKPRNYTKHNITKKRIINTVKLYRSIDELKRINPTVDNKHIYRIAGMIPGNGEFMGVPPMYYIGITGKMFSISRKSYRELAHKFYEYACKSYKLATGHCFGYSITNKPAYKFNKK